MAAEIPRGQEVYGIENLALYCVRPEKIAELPSQSKICKSPSCDPSLSSTCKVSRCVFDIFIAWEKVATLTRQLKEGHVISR